MFILLLTCHKKDPDHFDIPQNITVDQYLCDGVVIVHMVKETTHHKLGHQIAEVNTVSIVKWK